MVVDIVSIHIPPPDPADPGLGLETLSLVWWSQQ